MIKDWNRENLQGCVFHFKNSLRPFIEIDNNTLLWLNGDFLFLDINEMRFYRFEDLELEGLEFYSDPNDSDFMGVEVCGKFKWDVE